MTIFSASRRRALVVAAAFSLAAVPTYVQAAGNYPGYDPANSPYSTYTPTGNEFVPMDTQLPGGQPPQTIGLMSYEIAGVSPALRNALVGGDFQTNPWQRGTSTSGDISNTLTYWADQWWNLGGASSAINVSRQTTTAVPGSGYVMRFARKSANANTAQICTGNTLTTNNSMRFAGQTAIFSAWLDSGALFSSAGNNIAITIAYGTGTDESAANFAAGTWTGYTVAYSGNTAVTTTKARYSVAGAIPSTATQVGVKLCYTPVGTAGATDHFQVGLAQLEAVGAQIANNTNVTQPYLNNTALTLSQYAQPSSFAFRPAQLERELAQAFFYQLTESAASNIRGTCAMSTTSIANCYVQFPVTLRAAPTMTYATGFAASASTASSSVTACTANTTSATLSTNAATTQGVLMNCASSAGFGAAGTAGFLWDGAGTGKIQASAEL